MYSSCLDIGCRRWCKIAIHSMLDSSLGQLGVKLIESLRNMPLHQSADRSWISKRSENCGGSSYYSQVKSVGLYLSSCKQWLF